MNSGLQFYTKMTSDKSKEKRELLMWTPGRSVPSRGNNWGKGTNVLNQSLLLFNEAVII